MRATTSESGRSDGDDDEKAKDSQDDSDITFIASRDNFLQTGGRVFASQTVEPTWTAVTRTKLVKNCYNDIINTLKMTELIRDRATSSDKEAWITTLQRDYLCRWTCLIFVASFRSDLSVVQKLAHSTRITCVVYPRANLVRAFCVAGPREWNYLPLEMRTLLLLNY